MKIGVHTSHCCIRHGCKYGDEECPVVLGTHEQRYDCEDCYRDHEEHDNHIDKKRLDFFEQNASWFRYSGASTITMNGEYPRWSVWTPKEGRTSRKTLREAIDAAMDFPIDKR